MGFTLTEDVRNAKVDAATAKLNEGSAGDAQVEVLDDSDNVLATFDLPDPVFPSASNGSATANAISQVTVDSSGTASQWRAYDKDGTLRFSGDAGATGSGASMELTNTSLTEGDPVEIDSWTYTQPAS